MGHGHDRRQRGRARRPHWRAERRSPNPPERRGNAQKLRAARGAVNKSLGFSGAERSDRRLDRVRPRSWAKRHARQAGRLAIPDARAPGCSSWAWPWDTGCPRCRGRSRWRSHRGRSRRCRTEPRVRLGRGWLQQACMPDHADSCSRRRRSSRGRFRPGRRLPPVPAVPAVAAVPRAAAPRCRPAVAGPEPVVQAGPPAAVRERSDAPGRQPENARQNTASHVNRSHDLGFAFKNQSRTTASGRYGWTGTHGLERAVGVAVGLGAQDRLDPHRAVALVGAGADELGKTARRPRAAGCRPPHGPRR